MVMGRWEIGMRESIREEEEREYGERLLKVRAIGKIIVEAS